MSIPGVPIKPRVILPKDPEACWGWNLAVSKLGDAYLTFNGKNTLARRWMWEQMFGQIPDACMIYTTCGTKTCVNPFHLRCGVAADMRMAAANTTLRAGDVLEIRLAKRTRTRQTANLLAERFGVSATTIRDVWAGRTHNRKKRKPAPQLKLEAATEEIHELVQTDEG